MLTRKTTRSVTFKGRQLQHLSRIIRSEIRFHRKRVLNTTSDCAKHESQNSIHILQDILFSLNTSKEASHELP